MPENYPTTLLEFEEQFSTDDDCAAYLAMLRWPKGFHCPSCGSTDYWLGKRQLYICVQCKHQTSVTAGTILHGARQPLRLWFRAMWYISTQKYGTNALGLQRVLGLGSYNTAWQWLQKFRRAMIRPQREKLTGIVEIDETYLGAPKEGKRGRGAAGKAVIVIAVEDREEAGIGRIRLAHIKDASGDSLHSFIKESVETGTMLITDDWSGYSGIELKGYELTTAVSKEMKLAHLVASLLKRWILGTYQGSVKHSHLAYYLDEFTFRFNRRTCKSRGKLFYRLAQQVVMADPAPLRTLKGTKLDFIAPKTQDID